MRDPYWQPTLMGCGVYRPWLSDAGSLTLRIRQRCQHFSVHNIRAGLTACSHEEGSLLGLRSRDLLYTRDVLLLADQQPVVFAHSVVSPRCLRTHWHALRKLGDRSLGTLLFQHPQVKRAPLHWRRLRSTHTLHQHASTALNTVLPQSLWARRSLFLLKDAPLLVTEIFLPAILKLRDSNLK